ncbi:hypothetical protein DFJ73DRAFT_71907 [Zopfochytrium polystomum]|nr:hypothetical protein DFJ73DRAFT_71907 [Zopfochytrium polystomum]
MCFFFVPRCCLIRFLFHSLYHFLSLVPPPPLLLLLEFGCFPLRLSFSLSILYSFASFPFPPFPPFLPSAFPWTARKNARRFFIFKVFERAINLFVKLIPFFFFFFFFSLPFFVPPLQRLFELIGLAFLLS